MIESLAVSGIFCNFACSKSKNDNFIQKNYKDQL